MSAMKYKSKMSAKQFDNIIKRLRLTKTKVQSATERASEQIGNFMLDESVRLCPRDTGTLESSLRLALSQEGREYVAKVYITPVQNPKYTGAIGGRPRYSTDYARYAHDLIEPEGYKNRGPGTQAKGDDAGGGFMRRALHDNANEYFEIYRRALHAEVK